ncbi:MAG: integration host factor subunit alpha [Lautropia sp.]|nr:integration host factor subunit alpha [Lautropia sp.]
MVQNAIKPDADDATGTVRGNDQSLGALSKPTFTLTKAALADLLFERVGLNKREAKDMVETFFEEISAALIRGESVKLSGFGNFQLRDKQQRPGRNPKTGEEIPISARRVVTFHASQKLKAQIDTPRREQVPLGSFSLDGSPSFDLHSEETES